MSRTRVNPTESGQTEVTLPACVNSKLQTADAVLVRYIGDDCREHVHVHVIGKEKGPEPTMAFLRYLLDEWIPETIRMMGN